MNFLNKNIIINKSYNFIKYEYVFKDFYKQLQKKGGSVMSEALKMAIASFELKEGREPNTEEMKMLEMSASIFFDAETQSGCMINYS